MLHKKSSPFRPSKVLASVVNSRSDHSFSVLSGEKSPTSPAASNDQNFNASKVGSFDGDNNKKYELNMVR